jgi:tetratricopeptide (TPR) repeat protein
MALLSALDNSLVIIFGALGAGFALLQYFRWRETQPSSARNKKKQTSSSTPGVLIGRLIGFTVIAAVVIFMLIQIISAPTGEYRTEYTTEEDATLTTEMPAILVKADELYQAGDNDGALALYQQQLVNQPEDHVILVSIGNCYYNLLQYDQADRYYQKALDNNPNQVIAWNNRALIQYNKKNYKEALSYLSKGLEIDDAYGNAWDLKGNCHYDQEEYALAKEAYQKAYDYGVRYIELYEKRGWLEETDGNINEAIALYQEGLAFDNSSEYIQQRLAELVRN